MNNSEKIRFLTVTGIIAGLYAALTVGLAPLSFGLVQCRVAEMLTVLAVYTPAAVPGLTVGCILSNLIGLAMGANIAGALDVVLGTLATGLAAWLSYLLRRQRLGGSAGAVHPATGGAQRPYRGHRAGGGGPHLYGAGVAGADGPGGRRPACRLRGRRLGAGPGAAKERPGPPIGAKSVYKQMILP